MITRMFSIKAVHTPTSSGILNFRFSCHECLRHLSSSAVDLGKPHSINGRKVFKGRSMETYTKRFMDGGMTEPKMVWHTVTGVSKGAQSGPKFMVSKTTKRRINNLNQIFLDSISDIISSGVIGMDLMGRQLTISKVEVLEGLTGIRVYWFCGTQKVLDDDLSIEELLKSSGRAIRQELVNQRVAGHVPPLTFIQDEQLHAVQEVESILYKLRIKEQLELQWQQELKQQQAKVSAGGSVPDAIFSNDFRYTGESTGTKEDPNKRWMKTGKSLSHFSSFGRQQSACPTISNTISSFMDSCRLNDGLFGVQRNKIMEKIICSLNRAQALGEGINSNSYPFLICEPGPVRERNADEPFDIHFASKSSLRSWGSEHVRSGNSSERHCWRQSEKELIVAGEPLAKHFKWEDANSENDEDLEDSSLLTAPEEDHSYYDDTENQSYDN